MPPPEVLVYTKSWCPYCARAKALLRGKGVVYTEVDVEAVPERRDEMIAASGRRTVPQIFIGARHIGGCDDLHELDAAGGLDPLLAG
jgi:glutaredoxin 3